MKHETFTAKVLEVVRHIPKGRIMTYKAVAIEAGNPQAARAVGTILKNNDNPAIPCHRVIRSDGTVGGYNGLAGKKRELLVQEGAL